MQLRLWIKISLLFLIIATSLGAFLRYLFVDPVSGINFNYFLHTHSHIAFLGWIFNLLFAGLIYSFLPLDFHKGRKYNILFYLLVLSVLGMMFSFPFQGYGAVSISFSTLHVFLSWAFAVFFFRDTFRLHSQKPISLIFAYWSLAFMLLSSLGPFALGYIMATEVGGPYEKLAIYFYLHLQYDGWFTFAIFSLLYHFLERNKIPYNGRSARIFLWVFALCCLPAYASSTLWADPPGYVYVIAVLASLFQLIGLYYMWYSLKDVIEHIKASVGKAVFRMVTFALSCFILKNILQVIGVEPQLAGLVYQVRNFLIFYLHLIFLGFVTIFLLSWLRQMGFWKLNSKLFVIFIFSFVVSEILLILQPLLLIANGNVIPNYFLILFLVSLLMPVVLIINFFNKRGVVNEVVID